MINDSSEKLFLHYIFKNPAMFELINGEFFESEHLKIIYNINQKFFNKYHKVANKSQLKQLLIAKSKTEFFETNDKNEKVFNDSIYNTIMDIKINEYDETWLNENFESWAQFKTLNSSVFDLVTYLKTTKVTSENIKDTVSTAIEIIQKKNNIDFSHDDGSNFFDANTHKSFKGNCFPTGYKWLDQQLGGGYNKGGFVVIAGASKSGKCLDFDTYINIRNKKTGEVKKIKIGEFYNLIKQNKTNEN